MSTYGEVVYMVLDELKLMSDDSYFQQEHVIFLLDKYRGLLLKKYYTDVKKEIPNSNYLTICIELEKTTSYDNDSCGNTTYLKSKEKIPNVLTVGSPKLNSKDRLLASNITYVDRERFPYVGNNKYLSNIIYGTISSDDYLYIKSNNPQAYYLSQVTFTGIFEDAAKASEMECDKSEDSSCDILDKIYPLEEGLIPEAIQLIVKELIGAAYRPKDGKNDANDDLSDIIMWARRNMKNNLTKQLED